MSADLIEMIYDAALDESRWTDFLSRTAEEFNSGPTVLAIHDLRGRFNRVNLWVGADLSTTKEYEEHYVRLNPWMQNGRMFSEGLVARGEELCSQNALEKTEFYNEFGLRRGVTFTLGTAIQISGSAVLYLSVNRGIKAETFRAGDAELMSCLVPHLRKAMRIHQHLAAAKMYADATNVLPVGMLALASDLSILECNGIAQQILNKRKFLTVCTGKLTAADPNVRTSFECFIKSASVRDREKTNSSFVYQLPDVRSQNRLSVLAVPGKDDLLTGVRSRLLLILIDPSRREEETAPRLCSLFGLTSAEARLTLQILRTKTLTEASRSLGISRNTAKTQLSSIFLKTETQSQPELLRLLLAGPLRFRV